MNKMIRNCSSVTYNDNNISMKCHSNEVEVNLFSSEIQVDYESYKNTVYVGETCTFIASIYNKGITPLLDITAFFNFSDNLPYVISSLYINNHHCANCDISKGIRLGNLSSYQTIKIKFNTKAVAPFKAGNAFSQMLVTYGYYQHNTKIVVDQQSNLVSIKILG